MTFREGLVKVGKSIGSSLAGGLMEDVFGRMGAVASGGAALPSSEEGISHQWTANGVTFSYLTNGMIEVVKRNGRIRRYRPYRPVTIPKKWNARAMGRVATALKRHREMALDIVRISGGIPYRTPPAARQGGKK
jgi:hypothetical protein